MNTAKADPAEPILLCRDAGGVATLVLNRPGQFNSLSSALPDALQTQLDAIAADAGVRACSTSSSAWTCRPPANSPSPSWPTT